MRRPFRPVVLAALCLTFGSVAGCGGPGPEASTATGTPSPAASATPTAPPVDLPDPPRFDTPLEQLVAGSVPAGTMIDPDAPDGRRWVEQVTACMAAQGYAWTYSSPPGNADRWTGESVAAHGYGRVDQARRMARLVETPAPDPFEDWTPEQRAAYDWALEGGYPPGRTDVGSWVDGCRGIASRAVWGIERDGLTMQTDTELMQWVDFESDVFAMHRAAQDAVLADALAAWHACMAAAGFPETADVTDPLEVGALVDDRVDQVRSTLQAAGRRGVADSPELAEVQRYELALAQTDLLGCRTTYDRTRYDARLAAEQTFVAERADDVAGWSAYLEAQAAPRP